MLWFAFKKVPSGSNRYNGFEDRERVEAGRQGGNNRRALAIAGGWRGGGRSEVNVGGEDPASMEQLLSSGCGTWAPAAASYLSLSPWAHADSTRRFLL